MLKILLLSHRIVLESYFHLYLLRGKYDSVKKSYVKLSKEEYLNMVPKSKRELNEKTYDFNEMIESPDFKAKPVLERVKARRELKKLYDERDKPISDFQRGSCYSVNYEDEVTYDENGMRSDDEYNPKNWQGHDD